MWRCVIDIEDEPDFERFVRERGPALRRAAVLLVGDVHLGEDLLQEVLVRMSTRWRAVRGHENLDAYVHKALVNTATSWKRRRRWQERPSDEMPEGRVDAPGYDDTVLRALRLLPRGQRTVVILRYYLDYTERQAAAVMACSIGTVKSQNARAVATLRDTLGSAVSERS